MQTVPENPFTPSKEPRVHIRPDEVEQHILGTPEKISEQEGWNNDEQWKGLFDDLESLEMAKTDAEIENEFEQKLLKELIRLRAENRTASWPQMYRAAMVVARRELLPLVKQHHKNVQDQQVEDTFARLALQTIERIAAGSITTPELEELKAQIPQRSLVEPANQPQPYLEATDEARLQRTNTFFEKSADTAEAASAPLPEINAPGTSTTTFKHVEQQEAPQVGNAPAIFNLQQLQQMEALKNNPPSLADIAGATAAPEKPAAPAAPRYPTAPSMRKKQEQQDGN